MEFEAGVCTREDGQVTLTVAGELDIETASALEAVAGAIPPQAQTVVDLQNLRFLDGAGRAALERVAWGVERSGGEVRLAGLSGQPRRLLERVARQRAAHARFAVGASRSG